MNRGEYHILIVDDELRMRELLSFYLEKAGFRVSEAATGQEALTKIAGDRDSYELVILDIMMPDQDGFEVCQAVREYSEVPILMLSARTEVQDRIEGLNLGADDYLTKPFEVEELLARVHALLRRALIKQTDPDKKNLVFKDGLKIFYKNRTVYVNDRLLELTLKEFNLLYKLASSPKRVFSREDLLNLIWGEDYEGAQRTVDSHIKNIRSKLYSAGLEHNRIITVWKIGYKFI